MKREWLIVSVHHDSLLSSWFDRARIEVVEDAIASCSSTWDEPCLAKRCRTFISPVISAIIETSSPAIVWPGTTLGLSCGVLGLLQVEKKIELVLD